MLLVSATKEPAVAKVSRRRSQKSLSGGQSGNVALEQHDLVHGVGILDNVASVVFQLKVRFTGEPAVLKTTIDYVLIAFVMTSVLYYS